MRLNPYSAVITLVCIVAAAMAALLLLLLPRPAEVVRIMQWRMSRLESFRLDADLRYDDGNSGVPIRVQLDLDRHASAQPLRRYVFDARLGGEGSWAGVALARGNEWLARFDETPQSQAEIDLTPYGRKWLAIKPDLVRAGLGQPIVNLPGRGPSDDDRARLVAYGRSAPFFGVRERLEDAAVRGLGVYRFRTGLEPLFLKEYLAKAESARLGRPLADEERVALDRFFAEIAWSDVELWIGKRDYYLYKLTADASRTHGAKTETLRLTLEFSRFNEPVLFKWPDAPAENADALVVGLFKKPAASLQTADAAEKKSAVSLDEAAAAPASDGDPDRDGLSNELETFYRTDRNNPDSDGDGVSDGDEVNAGMNPAGPGGIFDFGITH